MNDVVLLETKELPNIQLLDEQKKFISSKEKILVSLANEETIAYEIVYRGVCVGFIQLDETGKEDIFLHNIYIDNSYQNNGIGKESIKLLFSILKGKYKNLYTTYVWGNDIAKHVYETLGFKEVNVIDENGIHEVDMLYILK